jgi:hypothetical protein
MEEKLLAKEKECDALRNDMKTDFISKGSSALLEEKIFELKKSVAVYVNENTDLQNANKFLEKKLMSIHDEKERYLTELLKQKDKQAEILDEAQQMEMELKKNQ